MAGRVTDAQVDGLAAGARRARAPRRPRDTSRPGCARAGADTGWSRPARRLRVPRRAVGGCDERSCHAAIVYFAGRLTLRRSSPPCTSVAPPLTAVPAIAHAAPEARRGAAPRAPATCGCSATRSTPSARRCRALRPGQLAQLRTHRDAFIGHVVRQPARAHLRAHPLAGRSSGPSMRRCSRQRLRAALALRERLDPRRTTAGCSVSRTCLPGLVLDRYGDVVVGQIATAGMESAQGASRGGGAPRCCTRRRSTGRTTPARASSSSCRRSARPPSARCPRQLDGAGIRASRSRVPLAAARRPAGSTTRPPTARGSARYVSPGARVLDVCSLRRRLGGRGAAATAPAARCASTPRRRARRRPGQRGSATASAWRLLREDAFDALKLLRRAGRALRRRHPRPAGLHQAQEGHRAGAGGVPQAQPAGARRCSRDEGVLVSCSCSYHLAPEELAAAPSRPRHVTAGASCRSSRPAASPRTIRCTRPSPKRGTSRPSSAA